MMREKRMSRPRSEMGGKSGPYKASKTIKEQSEHKHTKEGIVFRKKVRKT